MSSSHDLVARPAHYQGEGGLQAWDVIEDWRLGYHLGNAVKYLLRAHRKGNELQDLEKAGAYLVRAGDLTLRGVPLVTCTKRVPKITLTRVAEAFRVPGGGGGARMRVMDEIFAAALAPIPIDARTHLVRAEAHLGTALEGVAA